MIVISIDAQYQSETYPYFQEWNDEQKYKKAIIDDEIMIYENIKDFEHALNNDFVDTENRYIYFLDI